jgi:hypothetical protein
MRCLLGPKKTAKCATIIGRPVSYATVRGGGQHFVAIAAVPIPSTAHPFHEEWRVNYRTGQHERIDPAAEHEAWEASREHEAARKRSVETALTRLRDRVPGSIADDLRAAVEARRG